MKKALWIAAIVVAMATAQRARGAGEHVQDGQAVMARLAAFAAAWNKHDARELSDMFAEDATLHSASGRLAKGHAEIERLLEEEQNASMKTTTFAWIASATTFLERGRVMVTGECEILGMTGADGKPALPARFRISAIWAEKDSQWKILPWMFIRLPPSKPPATVPTK